MLLNYKKLVDQRILKVLELCKGQSNAARNSKNNSRFFVKKNK